jgi:hypothetical protein
MSALDFDDDVCRVHIVLIRNLHVFYMYHSYLNSNDDNDRTIRDIDVVLRYNTS